MDLYKVLIVDDETIIREGLRKHVNWADLGLEVSFTADNAESALKYAEISPPDILITDICLRGKDGLHLVEDLLERGIAPLVILISSYNDFSYAQRAVRLSVVREYILKPIDMEHLSRVLTDLKNSLSHNETISSSSSEPEISVSIYRNFLQKIQNNGYDRYQLVHYIKTGNTEKVMEIWSSAERIMLHPSTSLNILRRFSFSFIISLISDGILSEDNSDAQDPLKIIDHCASCQDITSYITNLICQKSNAIQQGSQSVRSKLIDSCLKIIDREYCNPDFNLTVLAAELNVAPNYLSSRFKDEMGIGFMKYRLEKQMEKAKLLLRNPSYKIYSVSILVGFLDEKYFSKQFKKYTGDTPKDYRNKQFS
jgi:two-component system response regulator YesN